MSEQDEPVRSKSPGLRSGQWAASGGEIDDQVDATVESWTIVRSVANPSRLRLGTAQGAESTGVTVGA
ncbi:hypothetical protein [Frankia sp. Cppng1_Ct_nod]|uniref:hypothetical protein n=1 Tax=Frankia sp. Cppng1_Ct_nod TaxID=2897162 RepID=UPI0010415034|nr:hypothetical protein [Frankia sp. Cppng1_Ct_nod]